MTGGRTPGAQQRERLHWVDFAKAVAIVLVVLYHVGGAGMDRMFPDPGGHASGLWTRVNAALLPMRMPLFFLTAGLLAHRAVRRPWPVVWRGRILVLLWPYLLWSVAFAAIAGFAYRPDDPFGYTINRLQVIPYAGTAYWFLAVLTVFFVAAKLLRRWPLVVLAVTLALAAVAPYLEPLIDRSLPELTTYAIIRVGRYAFWYFLGCYAYDAVERLAHVNPWPLVLGGGAAFVAMTYFSLVRGYDRPLAFALSVAGLTAAVGASVIAVRAAPVRRLSRYVAGRTLSIYLVHPLLVNLLVLATLHLGGPLTPNESLATWLAPLITIAGVVVSVVVYDRVSASRAAWVFAPPAALTRERRAR
jgi:uncharacterized membrane protein YcfT